MMASVLALLIFALLCLTNESIAIILPKGLADAEEAQSVGDVFGPKVVSQIIPEAQPTELANGDGDLSTVDNCADDILEFCPTIKPGEGRISACMTNQQNEEEKGIVEGKTISEQCKKEMRAFKIDRATNINKDIRLAVACKADVDKYCNSSSLYPEPGAVLTCLREVKDSLSEMCQEEVTRTQIQAAKDFKVDAMLNELCSADAESLCPDVTPGNGRIQYCLRGKRSQLSWDCQEELFRQEVENADDIRLQITLLRKCMRDKKKFCDDVKPGNARVKECLEDHRKEPGFSTECRDEFEAMMARRAGDFRLDAKLRELCKDDIEEVCGYEKDSLDSIAGYDGRVIECLQDYKDELQSPGCKARVHILTMRAAEDIRFDRPLADACYTDRQKLCNGVTPGDARVLRCLQDNRQALSYECRATLFDQEVRLSEDIDFQYPMKKSCSAEIIRFCKDIPHGNARVIKCLTDNDDSSEMSSECRAEVKRYEIRAGEDYRLNYRLNKACDTEIDKNCADVCSPFQGQACGGVVLQCLSDNRDNLTDASCRNEIFNVQQGWTKDFRTDAVLRKACSDDVNKYCSKVEKGEGRVHDCLRKNKENLSPNCAAQELKLNVIQAEDIRLRPGMMKDCSEEISVYCKDVKPGKARMYRCLQNNMGQVDFSSACKARLTEKQLAQESYYKLDFGIKSMCGKDVDALCNDKKGSGHGKAAVLKCLISKHDQISSDSCSAEVSRAVRNSLWQYHKGSSLTSACDLDVTKSCGNAKESEPGAVGVCLANTIADKKPVADDCRMLVSLAAPNDPKKMFDDMLVSSSLYNMVQDIRDKGVKQVIHTNNETGESMVTLTGWIALAAVTALVVVTVGTVVFLYRRWTGKARNYTVVVKNGGV